MFLHAVDKHPNWAKPQKWIVDIYFVYLTLEMEAASS